jgi:hypothetical protein
VDDDILQLKKDVAIAEAYAAYLIALVSRDRAAEPTLDGFPPSLFPKLTESGLGRRGGTG